MLWLLFFLVQVDLPLDLVNQQNKILKAFKNVQTAAEHYGIYKDLFNYDYFKPIIDLKVSYDSKMVYYGNKLKAQDVIKINLFFFIKLFF